MENKSKSLHVNPVGENWEVESDAITLGQTETKSEAIELAKELASTAEVVKHRRPYFGRLRGDRNFSGSISQKLQHRTVVLCVVASIRMARI